VRRAARLLAAVGLICLALAGPPVKAGHLDAINAAYFGWCGGTLTSSSTLFLAPPACATTGFETPVPVAGTAQNLYVKAGTAGRLAASGVVTLVKNGSATALTCTIGTATTCNDTTHTVAIAKGDSVKFQVTTQSSETLANVEAAFQIQ
jgi:hypothetical protein